MRNNKISRGLPERRYAYMEGSNVSALVVSAQVYLPTFSAGNCLLQQNNCHLPCEFARASVLVRVCSHTCAHAGLLAQVCSRQLARASALMRVCSRKCARARVLVRGCSRKCARASVLASVPLVVCTLICSCKFARASVLANVRVRVCCANMSLLVQVASCGFAPATWLAIFPDKPFEMLSGKCTRFNMFNCFPIDLSFQDGKLCHPASASLLPSPNGPLLPATKGQTGNLGEGERRHLTVSEWVKYTRTCLSTSCLRNKDDSVAFCSPALKV